jgi:hypothetical protein
MPLKSFVVLAKKNTPLAQSYDPSRPITNFIDATEESVMLAKAEANGTKLSWESCKCLKKDPTGKHLCSQFFTNCVQEKCKTKFIRV